MGRPLWRIVALALPLAALLAACGNKGPLYLPEKAEPAAEERTED